MTEYYHGIEDAYEAPFEPKTPCRQFETRACVDLVVDTESKFREEPCPAGECQRFPNRDKSDHA